MGDRFQKANVQLDLCLLIMLHWNRPQSFPGLVLLREQQIGTVLLPASLALERPFKHSRNLYIHIFCSIISYQLRTLFDIRNEQNALYSIPKMKSMSSLHSYSPFGALALLAIPVRAVQRTIGLSSDGRTQEVVQDCFSQGNSTAPEGFNFGECPRLVKCVLDGLPSDVAAGMQSGANISSLVPTILAIVGMHSRS